MVLNLLTPVELIRLNFAIFMQRVEAKELHYAVDFVVLNKLVVLMIGEQHAVNCKETHLLFCGRKNSACQIFNYYGGQLILSEDSK